MIDNPPSRLRILSKEGLNTKDFEAFGQSNNNTGEESEELIRAGELYVFNYEYRYLINNRREHLSRRIIHTYRMEGDAGFDIQSYETTRREKLINVKTTVGSNNTSFNLTIRELAFSRLNSEYYHLYRVYNFDLEKNTGMMYILQGDLYKSLHIRPTSFEAYR